MFVLRADRFELRSFEWYCLNRFDSAIDWFELNAIEVFHLSADWFELISFARFELSAVKVFCFECS